MNKRIKIVEEKVRYYSLSIAAKLLGTTVKKFTEIAGEECVTFRNLRENGPLMVRADDVDRLIRKKQKAQTNK